MQGADGKAYSGTPTEPQRSSATARRASGARSGPVSRILSRPEAGMVIHLGRTSPCASSRDPGLGGQPRRPCSRCTGWGLPSHLRFRRCWCALTAPFHPCPHLRRKAAGGLLSVALSVVSPRPGVTWHPALRCPDFPRRAMLPPRAATIRPAPRPGTVPHADRDRTGPGPDRGTMSRPADRTTLRPRERKLPPCDTPTCPLP